MCGQGGSKIRQYKVVRVLVGVGGNNVWSTGVGSKIMQDNVVRVLMGVGAIMCGQYRGAR